MIIEGLERNDLKNMILPLISVNQFESKIGDDVMVFAFFCTEKEAAHDLNLFIQKGIVDVIDCEVSPAPDEDGYYLVFVDIQKDKAISTMKSLLDQVERLVEIDKWKASVYGYDKTLDFDDLI